MFGPYFPLYLQPVPPRYGTALGRALKMLHSRIPNQAESGTQIIECCCADRSGRVPTHNIKSVLAEVLPKASSVKGWAVVHQEGLAVPS